MIGLIVAIIFFLFAGDILGHIILIQSIPKFKIAKKHPLIVIKLYYGFHMYLILNNEIDWRFKIRYLFLSDKFIIFTYCFCYCLEKYIESHPQKEVVCRKNIRYMSSPLMRETIYRNTERNLACA